MTYRDVLNLLKRAGAEPVRVRGSHQTWRLTESSTSVTVVINHLGHRADWGLLAQLRKLGVLPKDGRHA